MSKLETPLVPYEAVSFPIGGRNVYRGLIAKYIILSCYAAGSFYVGAVTVGRAAGPFYAQVFPVALLFSCLAALYGVVRSRYTRKVWIEYVGTVLLIAGLVSYACALAYTAVASDEVYKLPPSLLPIGFCVFPTLRLINILGVVRARNGKQARR